MKWWECFQRKSGKEPAGMRPMPTLRIGPGGPEPKFGNRLRRPPPPKDTGPFRSHLQRVPLPYFCRKAEVWPEFRRYFRKLTADEQFPPGIMMAQIREPPLTEEAKS